MKILIVEAPFYKDISDMLFEGAKEVFDQEGVEYERVEVPGALEIPAVIGYAAESDAYDGFLALGCVIRGETYHFDIVSNESARGIMDLNVQGGLAVANGILTAENKEQAIARADKNKKNKGGSFARAVLTLCALRQKFIDEA